MAVALHHVYHFYADGQWQKCWSEHLKALNMTGLDKHLTSFCVGIVGSDENRQIAREAIEAAGGSVVVEATEGFEQVTLEWLQATANVLDGYYFYAHTKGAGYPNELQDPWRRTMEYDCAVHWGECVGQLKRGMDCAGSVVNDDEKWGTTPYFAGNYWWATDKYLRKLPPIISASRFFAETWLGYSPTGIKYYAARTGDFPSIVWNEDWV